MERNTPVTTAIASSRLSVASLFTWPAGAPTRVARSAREGSVVPASHISSDRGEEARAADEKCCLCQQPIALGYMVTDDEGYRYCEECWQP